MSDVENPWQSPQSASVPQNITQGVLTDTMLRYLKQASPWLRFIGILGFIGCGIMAFTGIAMIFTMSVASSLWSDLWSEIPALSSFSGVIGAVFGGFILVLFLAFAVVWFFPCLFVYNFGDKIRSYLHSGADRELEAAFKNNKSLWKFFGILAIVYLAFIPLMIIGTVIAAVAVAIRG